MKRAKKAKTPSSELTLQQQEALGLLLSGENVFLTGGAGCGKSYVIRQLLQQIDGDSFPVLASTGAAAVLIGGRTFHSFFGLGIMEGGQTATVARALANPRLAKRLKNIEGFILDEVSMIPASAFAAAEQIAREARESRLPWGGLRVIVVGDFAQLPPVTQAGQNREWVFQTEVWQAAGFQNYLLTENLRSRDPEFVHFLNEIREGYLSKLGQELLTSRLCADDPDDTHLRLFPRRDEAYQFNQRELAKIPAPEVVIDTIYLGDERSIQTLQKVAPVPAQLCLKPGASVMFLQNDSDRRWVNGTRGTVVDIDVEELTIEKSNFRHVTVAKSQFSLMDADGTVRASAIQFPVGLAYATTIHKSQGATFDHLWVNLESLWEPGHAYVALSRLSNLQGLKLLGFSPKSFLVDPHVLRFYKSM